jgi:hypothetical protein
MTPGAGRSGQEHPADGGPPPETAQPWQVAWRTLLRHGVALDRETAQVLADAMGLALQPAGVPAAPTRRPRRPRRKPAPEDGCEPLFGDGL